MHHAVQHPDGTIDIIAGRGTSAPLDVDYCEGGDVILSSQSAKYMWTVDERRSGIVPVTVDSIYSACASDNQPALRIYAIRRRNAADRWYTAYGRLGGPQGEIGGVMNKVNGEGTRIYYASERIAYVDVASQNSVKAKPEILHTQLYPVATRGTMVYYIGDIDSVIECDTRSCTLIDTGMSSTNFECVRILGDCLIVHRKICTINNWGHIVITGERIATYDLRNCAEYDIGEYSPYECTHFYI